jgi:hypothetical protein
VFVGLRCVIHSPTGWAPTRDAVSIGVVCRRPASGRRGWCVCWGRVRNSFAHGVSSYTGFVGGQPLAEGGGCGDWVRNSFALAPVPGIKGELLQGIGVFVGVGV